jgi:DhnA family fructose-bisphosphate aldolase class Ia
MSGRNIRLSRLFPQGGANTVIVAMDHGQTFGPMPGLVEFTAAAERLKAADAVLMAPQMMRFSGNLFAGKGSPTPIVRLNWNTIHCEPWGYHEAYTVKANSVEAAVAAGADIVMVSLVLQTGSEAHDAANVQVFAGLVEESYRLDVPVIGEVFPAGDLRSRPAEFHDYIKRMCRIICELGADAIKTFYTGERFNEVTECVPIPVFALGAEKFESEVDALELAHKAVSAGAKGVVFGRNVVQADDPTRFLQRLKRVAQQGVPPAEA